MSSRKAPERPTTPITSSTADDPTTPRASRHSVPTTPTEPATRVTRNATDHSSTHVPDENFTKVWVTHSRRSKDDSKDEVPPFRRFNRQNCATLADLVQTQLPPAPVFRFDDPKFLSKTKTLSMTEQALDGNERLTKIVFAPLMLSELMEMARVSLRQLAIDFDSNSENDFVVAVSSWNTSVGLPDVVFSEKDTEDWIMRVILAPALHVALALRKKAIPILQRGVGRPVKLTASELGPYISSGPPETHSIPDGVVVDIGISIKAAVEVKCHNVLDETPEDTFTTGSRRPEEAEFLLKRLLLVHKDEHGNRRPGRAIKFNWPSKLPPISKNKPPPAADSETRILVQIFTQLVLNKCNLGMLSSYILSLFCFRDGQTLYVSNAFWSTGDAFLATIAWVAMALEVPGFERSKMDLPQADTSFWTDYIKYEIDAPGVVTQTLPDYPNQTPSGREQRTVVLSSGDRVRVPR